MALRIKEKAKNFVSNVEVNKKVQCERSHVSQKIQDLTSDRFYKGLTRVSDTRSKLDLKLVKKKFRLWDCAVKVYKVKT